jgi:hypothetical protein
MSVDLRMMINFMPARQRMMHGHAVFWEGTPCALGHTHAALEGHALCSRADSISAVGQVGGLPLSVASVLIK